MYGKDGKPYKWTKKWVLESRQLCCPKLGLENFLIERGCPPQSLGEERRFK